MRLALHHSVFAALSNECSTDTFRSPERPSTPPKTIPKCSHKEQTTNLISAAREHHQHHSCSWSHSIMWGGGCRRPPFLLNGGLCLTTALTHLAHPLATSRLPAGAGHPAEPAHPSTGHFGTKQSCSCWGFRKLSAVPPGERKSFFLKKIIPAAESKQRSVRHLWIWTRKQRWFKKNAGHNYKILETSDFITCTIFCGDEKVSHLVKA